MELRPRELATGAGLIPGSGRKSGTTTGIVIQSFTRRVALHSPPHAGIQYQRALIPEGATDQQVLEWTRGWLPDAAWEELRALLSEEAESLT